MPKLLDRLPIGIDSKAAFQIGRWKRRVGAAPVQLAAASHELLFHFEVTISRTSGSSMGLKLEHYSLSIGISFSSFNNIGIRRDDRAMYLYLEWWLRFRRSSANFRSRGTTGRVSSANLQQLMYIAID